MFSSLMRSALAAPLAALLLAADPAPSPLPTPSPVPVHGLPQIYAIYLPGDRTFHRGETVRGSVVTSTNVGYVEARVDYKNVALHRDGMGRFSLAYKVPWWLPPWIKHDWTLQIIARSIDGIEVKKYYPISIQ